MLFTNIKIGEEVLYRNDEGLNCLVEVLKIVQSIDGKEFLYNVKMPNRFDFWTMGKYITKIRLIKNPAKAMETE